MEKIYYKSGERGVTELGWLHSKHSFSFGEYYDPGKMGFGLLRVLNDDIVEPDQGFGLHPHNNMEIFSLVLEGVLQHRDNMGNGSVINKDEIQIMSAGTGILHSEFNPSDTEKVNFLLELDAYVKTQSLIFDLQKDSVVAAPTANDQSFAAQINS